MKKKIKVGFLVQMPQLWEKQEPVYCLMRKMECFDPWLIVIPDFDYNAGTGGEYSDEICFFSDICNDDKLIKAKIDNRWADLSDCGFDYVFYQRPYDYYLPEAYRSNIVSQYTKICYIPYATPERKECVIWPKGFFKNIYLGFMEDEYSAEYNNKLYSNGTFINFYNIGYPPFERCMQLSDKLTARRILWTPRWSYDPIVGGSHFFEYNDKLTCYDWGGYELVVRPHPMMWSNFIKEKLIDEPTIKEICQRWSDSLILVDNNKKIIDTFSEISILISDRSSVIPMFFLTGKPIIYCKYGDEYSVLFEKIIPGLYMVDDWNQLEEVVSKLMDNIDPLKDIRKKIINESFMQHKGTSMSIVKTLIKDYLNN